MEWVVEGGRFWGRNIVIRSPFTAAAVGKRTATAQIGLRFLGNYCFAFNASQSYKHSEALSYSTIASAAIPAAAKPPTPAFKAATAALLLVEGEPEEELDVEVPEVSLGCFVDVAAIAITPVPFVQTPLAGGGAELENVISAQLYKPPSGSPLVKTWIVAFVPSVILTPDGREKPVMQKEPNPCSVKVGLRTVLNAEPGSFPSPRTTSTFASM